MIHIPEMSLDDYVVWFYDRIRKGGKFLSHSFVCMELDAPSIMHESDPANSIEDYRKYNKAILALLNEYGLRTKIRGVLLRDKGKNKIVNNDEWIDRVCQNLLGNEPNPEWI